MDDVPVIGGEGGSQPAASESGVRPLSVLAALVAGVGALWLIGGGGTLGGADSAPTTIAFDPSPIVAETLAWSPTTGLGEVTRVDALTSLPGVGAVLVGIDRVGLSVYRSDDGVSWKPTVTLTPDAGASGLAATIGEEALVAVNHPPWGPHGGEPWLWRSGDGITWSGDVLNSPDDAAVLSVVPLDGGILATGLASSIDHDVLSLPIAVAELVGTGGASVEVNEGAVTVRIPPGPVIYSRQETGIESNVDSAIAWRGPDPTHLARSDWNAEAAVRTSLADGSLVASLGNRLAVSADGTSWDEGLGGVGSGEGAAWRDFYVGPSSFGDEIVVWEPGAGTAEIVGPKRVLGGGSIRTVVAAQSGIGSIVGGEYILPGEEAIPLWTDGSRQWFLTTSSLVVKEAGATRAVSIYAMEPSLNGTSLVIEVGNDRLEMPVSEWLAATRQINSEIPLVRTLIAHSLDGVTWSLQDWRQIAGVDATAPALFAADDFLLAVDQGIGHGPVGAWIGRPLR